MCRPYSLFLARDFHFVLLILLLCFTHTTFGKAATHTRNSNNWLGDCQAKTTCSSCTGSSTVMPSCVWCKVNSSVSLCVPGNYRGSEGDGFCEDFWWSQCTSIIHLRMQSNMFVVPGQFMGTEYSYLILLVIGILIFVVLVLVGLVLLCRRLGRKKNKPGSYFQ